MCNWRLTVGSLSRPRTITPRHSNLRLASDPSTDPCRAGGWLGSTAFLVKGGAQSHWANVLVLPHSGGHD